MNTIRSSFARLSVRRAVCAGLIGLSLALAVAAQNLAPQTDPFGAQQAPAMPPHLGSSFDMPSPFDIDGPIMHERLLRRINADRQKTLVAQTNKLLALVTELNAEVSRNDSASLTPAQLSKVAEIEKLAANVRKNMSTSVRDNPTPILPVYLPVLIR